MAIDWNAIYNEEYNRLPDIAALLQGQQDSAVGDLTDTYNKNSTKLHDQLNDALTASYVSNEIAKRDMAQRQAAQGISGGMTETAASDYLRDYRNTNNTAQKSYDTSYGDLTSGYNTNLTNTRNNYGQLIANAQSNRASQATSNTNAKAGFLQQEETNALAREQLERQKQQDALAAANIKKLR